MSENSKKLILIMIGFLIFVVAVPLILINRKEQKINQNKEHTVNRPRVDIEESKEVELNVLELAVESSRALGRLPSGDEKIGFNFGDEDESAYIEYISFADFYSKVETEFDSSIKDFDLPINIRTDVVNYYDLSRRFNLDPHIEDLNKDGIVIIPNPFNSNNFYGIFEEIYQKNIPSFISTDFIIYYYHQKINKIFKNVEENIFYKNLWDINFILFEKARQRYEARLAEIGNVNDRILEAERLSAAYFATSLEILRPKAGQVASSGDLTNPNLFSFFEGDIYTFNLPDYLKIDVSREVELINSKSNIIKSPVLLYERNYREFVVPSEYQSNAKLNNFYLATKWLSSSFPVHYKGDDCPSCKLNFDDWRISMITSAYISSDIFNDHELKNDWARIYKTLAFFKGLRGDLSYVHYRDALESVFGEDHEIDVIFSDNNPENINNLYKFQSKILEYEFLDIEGALDKKDPEKMPQLGVKMLSDFYWPNDYIFNELSHPNVGEYLGDEVGTGNITSCSIDNSILRCKGIFLDIVSIFYGDSLGKNPYYIENSNYSYYFDRLNRVRDYINKFPSLWHYNSYWQNLKILKKYLSYNDDNRPMFSRSDVWKNKELDTAMAAWVNFQLPADSFSINQKHQRGISGASDIDFIKYNYLEPNISLIDEQIATINMIQRMFALLKITEELRSVFMDLEDLRGQLQGIRRLMIKELGEEDLSIEELVNLSILSREYSLNSSSNKGLVVSSNNGRRSYDISSLRIAIVVLERGDHKYLTMGPIFNPIER